jgi:MYXO-CTERM domain-containing protein
MSSPLVRSFAVLAPLTALALLAAPSRAQACGGTFCDNLPEPMPVDQAGEDILFVIDGSEVEVHVRIQYEGEAERFAWLLPLQGVPEVAVGSDLLFTALSTTLAPRWTPSVVSECDEDPSGGSEGDGDDGGGIKLDLADGDDGGGPDVVFQQVVGAFEVVVLQGGTAAEVLEFLDQNDYAQDPAAEPILQEYLDEGFLFAAVKLSAGAEVDEIHPLAFKFAGTEPCVPLRLTRIAAKQDMGVRAYFLGQDRWAPQSYAHLVLNPLAYAWNQPSDSRYLELLSLAVDAAGGHAFVTEFAGASGQVPTTAIYRPSWDETAFLGVDPIQAIELIDAQSLASHPLIRALLLEFIPPPDGVPAQEFWNNLPVYVDQIDLEAWDDVAFAAALSERIIEPGLHAVDLLDTWPKLTRLHTTISPAEMTIDPMFVANADLPDVDNRAPATVRRLQCDGESIYEVDLEGVSTPVCVPSGQAYPSAFASEAGWGETMPLALRVEQIPSMGPPQVVIDNAEAIAAAYAAYEAGVECLADGGTGDTGGAAEAGDDGDTGDTGDGELPYTLPYSVTCACSTAATERDGAPLGLALGLAVLAVIAPRRRREQPRPR